MFRSYLGGLLCDDRINKSEKILINIDDVQPEIWNNICKTIGILALLSWSNFFKFCYFLKLRLTAADFNVINPTSVCSSVSAIHFTVI